MNASKKEPRVTKKSVFKNLPKPALQIIRVLNYTLESDLFNKWKGILVKFVEYSIIYLIVSCGLGYGWILFLVSMWAFKDCQQKNIFDIPAQDDVKINMPIGLQYYPSWVQSPDFKNVSWINSIIEQLWEHIDPYSTYFMKEFIEPQIKKILDRMDLANASGFKIEQILLGTIPLKLGGIKVYQNSDTTSDEIVMDVDVAYNGDAKCQFTLHSIGAEINTIYFSGMARIVLKPLINTFPFVSGVEFYFLNVPQIEYSLGGIGTFGDLPGISNIIKEILETQVKARLVWPNRILMTLPIAKTLPKTYALRKPTGILTLTLVEGIDLVKKDKHLLGGGKSDPYAIISLGEKQVNFRANYIAKTLNPKWNYKVDFLLEEVFGQDIEIEIYDYDETTTDDFMGRCSIPLDELISNEKELLTKNQCIPLSDTKHGDIYLQFDWKKTKLSIGEIKNYSGRCIVSILIDSAQNLSPDRSENSLYPRVKIRLNQDTQIEQTKVFSKEANPKIEESFLIECSDILSDVINIDVVNTKNDTSLGKATLSVGNLILSGTDASEKIIKLSNALNENATLILTTKTYVFED